MTQKQLFSAEVLAWRDAMRDALKAQDQEKVVELWYGENGGKYNVEIASS